MNGSFSPTCSSVPPVPGSRSITSNQRVVCRRRSSAERQQQHCVFSRFLGRKVQRKAVS